MVSIPNYSNQVGPLAGVRSRLDLKVDPFTVQVNWLDIVSDGVCLLQTTICLSVKSFGRYFN